MTRGLRRLLAVMGALCLCACAASAEWAELEGFRADTAAEAIDFGERKIESYEALKAFLRRFPSLRKADLYATRVTGAQADELAALFPDVEFGLTMIIPCTKSGRDFTHVIRTDATAFSTLHNKRSPRHTEEEMHILKYCRNLRALDIGHNAVKDIGFLRSLPGLRVLIIALNEIEDITPLASLPELEYAEVFNNRITDLSPLAGLTNLLDLNIAFNGVSDLSPLYGLKGLERLWIYACSQRGPGRKWLTGGVVSELQANLPGTHVDAVHFPTTGGWREHPRYFVLAEMFQKGAYIPFAESPAPESEK